VRGRLDRFIPGGGGQKVRIDYDYDEEDEDDMRSTMLARNALSISTRLRLATFMITLPAAEAIPRGS
jgi:hypothetical protein